MRRLLLLTLLAAPALADVPPADTAGCGGRKEGEACKTDSGQAGSCVTSTCSRLDYSNGIPPSSKSYECMKCVSSNEAAAPPPVAADAPTTTKPAAPAPAPKEEKKSSCAMVPGELLVGLALALFRKKQRR